MSTSEDLPTVAEIIAMPRFVEKTDRTRFPGCWIWTAACRGNTPYFFLCGRSRNVRALLARPPKRRWVLAHCGNRLCVSPYHLQTFNAGDLSNYLRELRTDIESSWGPGSHQIRRTHCPNGHPYDAVNTYRAPSRPNERRCRACSRQRYTDFVRKSRGPGFPSVIHPSKRSPCKAAEVFGCSLDALTVAIEYLPYVQADIFRRYWGFDRDRAQSCEEIGRDLGAQAIAPTPAGYCRQWAYRNRLAADFSLQQSLRRQ